MTATKLAARFGQTRQQDIGIPDEDSPEGSIIPGYQRLLKVLRNPKHKEYTEYVAWLGGHPGKYHPYDSAHFDPKTVRFWDPSKRWEIAFSNRR